MKVEELEIQDCASYVFFDAVFSVHVNGKYDCIQCICKKGISILISISVLIYAFWARMSTGNDTAVLKSLAIKGVPIFTQQVYDSCQQVRKCEVVIGFKLKMSRQSNAKVIRTIP